MAQLREWPLRARSRPRRTPAASPVVSRRSSYDDMADPRTAALSVAWFVPGRPAVRPRLRIAAFTVPERLRHVFWVLSAGEFLAWAVLGVFSAVIPSLFGEILATRNLAVTAGALTVMIGMSAVAQLAARRVPIVAAQVAGLAVLAAGLAMLVGATFTGSAALAVRR